MPSCGLCPQLELEDRARICLVHTAPLGRRKVGILIRAEHVHRVSEQLVGAEENLPSANRHPLVIQPAFGTAQTDRPSVALNLALANRKNSIRAMLIGLRDTTSRFLHARARV